MHSYSEYYKTIRNSELLEIIQNPSNYQPLALEAAKIELENRKLSELEVTEAKNEIFQKQQKKEVQEQNISRLQNNAKHAGLSILDAFNPIQTSPLSSDRLIKIISFTYGAVFLLQVIKDFNSILYYVTEIASAPVMSLSYLIPLFLIPIAAYKFYFRKGIGWTLLTIFVTFSAVFGFSLLYQSIQYIRAFNWNRHEVTALNDLFHRPSPMIVIIQITFLLATAYVLCRKDIRHTFQVSKQKLVSTIVGACLAAFVFMFINS
jgi:hypothetical protein